MHEETATRAAHARKAILASFLLNLALAAAKLLAGWVGNSRALVADGIESSLDVVSSALLWGALKYAERPADETHPYGHGKAESVAAACGAMFILAAGILVGWESIASLFNPTPHEVPAVFTLWVLGAVVVLKEGSFRYLRKRGIETGSSAVGADAWHHRSDALTSLAAFIGIALARLGGPGWERADAIAALCSCAVIVANGFGMLRNAFGEVMDERVSIELLRALEDRTRSVPGVRSCEKCRIRKSGMDFIADLHVRVDGSSTVQAGHEISHAVKRALLDSTPGLTDVTIHIEPEAPATRDGGLTGR